MRPERCIWLNRAWNRWRKFNFEIVDRTVVEINSREESEKKSRRATILTKRISRPKEGKGERELYHWIFFFSKSNFATHTRKYTFLDDNRGHVLVNQREDRWLTPSIH